MNKYKSVFKEEGNVIWDTVDVSYSFKEHILVLKFQGYKLDKTVHIKYN